MRVHSVAGGFIDLDAITAIGPVVWDGARDAKVTVYARLHADAIVLEWHATPEEDTAANARNRDRGFLRVADWAEFRKRVELDYNALVTAWSAQQPKDEAVAPTPDPADETACRQASAQPVLELPAVGAMLGGVSRVETGPVKFGDDWTGVFIRGDSAFHYATSLSLVLAKHAMAKDPLTDAFARRALTELVELLRSCDERKL